MVTPVKPTMALRALLSRIEQAAVDAGVDTSDFRAVFKRNAAGDLYVGLVIKPAAKGSSSGGGGGISDQEPR